jgi:isopenicillin N synthase-like dioxygenase
MTGLPVIDIAAPEIAAALGRALEDTGFAYIIGHGVPRDTIDAAFAASRAFHASPLTQKQALAINEFHRGYMGLASSTVVTSSVTRVTRPNLSDSLMIMHEPAAAEIREPLQGPNQWPEWLSGFRAAIDSYRGELERVSRAVIRLIAQSLGLPETALDGQFARPTTFLRLFGRREASRLKGNAGRRHRRPRHFEPG